MQHKFVLGTPHAFMASAMDEGVEHKSPRSRFTVERVLLAVVLILQVGILLLLTSRSPSPAQPGLGESDAMSDPHASRRNLSSGPSPEYEALRASHIRSRSAQQASARRMVEEMDRMFERVVGNLEEMGHVASLDDGWDSLMAMPSFDVQDRGNAYHIRFSLPDGRAQGTELTLEGRVLTIGVAAPSQTRHSSPVVRCSRRILLPGPVAEAADARAFVTNGLLYVVVPKGSVPSSDSRTTQPVKVF